MTSGSPTDEASKHLDQTNIEEYYMNLLLLFIGLNVLLAFFLVFVLFWAISGITKKTGVYAQRSIDLREQIAAIDKQCKTAMNRLKIFENSYEPTHPGKQLEIGKCQTKMIEKNPGKQFDNIPTKTTEKCPAGKQLQTDIVHSEATEIQNRQQTNEIDFECFADIHMTLLEFLDQGNIGDGLRENSSHLPIRNDEYAINQRNYDSIRNMRYNLIRYCDEE